MAPPPAEFTVICIDNAWRAYWYSRIYDAQIEAIKYYCETIFKCNPDNIVSILTMSSLEYGVLVSPTSDLQQILRRLQDVDCCAEGQAKFQSALGYACSTFFESPPTMKRRLLMFVGGTINLERRLARLCGTKLKESGVALNVFNFYSLKIDYARFEKASILHGEYHYARRELDILVTTVNNNGNSHIVDVEDESSILDTLSKSILKKHLHYLEKKAAADNEYVEAPQIQFVKPELEQ